MSQNVKDIIMHNLHQGTFKFESKRSMTAESQKTYFILNSATDNIKDFFPCNQSLIKIWNLFSVIEVTTCRDIEVSITTGCS